MKSKYTAHLHPGKFEGESAATEYYYELMLEGVGEDICGLRGESEDGNYDDPDTDFATIFRVNAEESEAFDLPIGHIFMICEDSQGFGYGSVYASREEAEAKFRNSLGL